MDSSINLRNDIIFKAVFGYEKNEKLLISLLNAILELKGDKKIVSLTFLNAFNIKEYLNDKLTIVDVKVVDGTGVRYHIEMQVADDKS
ncbi:MAG: Rpn family recombination-promoting nuclease/putative transposase, partial [bacterium]